VKSTEYEIDAHLNPIARNAVIQLIATRATLALLHAPTGQRARFAAKKLRCDNAYGKMLWAVLLG